MDKDKRLKLENKITFPWLIGFALPSVVGVLAFSVVTILFNRILMSIAGSDGVASLTIIWYAQGLFGGLFRGYINGIASVVSFFVCHKIYTVI